MLRRLMAVSLENSPVYDLIGSGYVPSLEIDDVTGQIYAAGVAIGGGGGSFPRLDQVLDPNMSKIFNMTTQALTFVTTDSTASNTNGLSIQIIESGDQGYPTGLSVEANNAAASPFNGGDITAIFGRADDSSNGVADRYIGGQFEADHNGTGTTNTAMIGIYPVITINAGTVPAAYGMFVPDITGAMSNWAIKTNLGLVELGDALQVDGDVGFFSTTPVSKQAVTGAKLPSDLVMASLLTALAAYGLITDSTT